MKRVLLAVDESEASRRAADFVETFFAGQDISVLAVNVAASPMQEIPTAPYSGAAAWPHGPAESAEHAEEVTSQKEAEGAQLAWHQAPEGAGIEVVFGEPVEAIERTAEREGADLIVVGSRDRGFLDRLLNRSVHQDLARDPARPVLVVP